MNIVPWNIFLKQCVCVVCVKCGCRSELVLGRSKKTLQRRSCSPRDQLPSIPSNNHSPATRSEAAPCSTPARSVSRVRTSRSKPRPRAQRLCGTATRNPVLHLNTVPRDLTGESKLELPGAEPVPDGWVWRLNGRTWNCSAVAERRRSDAVKRDKVR